MQTDDVYLDGGSYDVTIVGHTGGAEFESLVLTDAAKVTAVDDSDATTVTLDDVSQTEGERHDLGLDYRRADRRSLVIDLSTGPPSPSASATPRPPPRRFWCRPTTCTWMAAATM